MTGRGTPAVIAVPLVVLAVALLVPGPKEHRSSPAGARSADAGPVTASPPPPGRSVARSVIARSGTRVCFQIMDAQSLLRPGQRTVTNLFPALTVCGTADSFVAAAQAHPRALVIGGYPSDPAAFLRAVCGPRSPFGPEIRQSPVCRSLAPG